jgi:DNA-binding transcriptional ArsR family regulator
MGLLDILKDIPLSANLQEKLRTLEAKYGALETENAILKDDLRKAQGESQRLKDKIDRAAHTSDLDDTKLAILKTLAQHDGSLYIYDLESFLQLQLTHLEYHLHELKEQGCIEKLRPMITRPDVYRLRQKGRQFVVENKLV